VEALPLAAAVTLQATTRIGLAVVPAVRVVTQPPAQVRRPVAQKARLEQAQPLEAKAWEPLAARELDSP
jgi:hypothetical protein